LKFIGQNPIKIKAGSKAEVVFFIEFPKDKITQRSTPIKIQIMEKDKQLEEAKTNFQGPN
jgi:hypothetical protein